MAKRKLLSKLIGRESVKKRWNKREERQANVARARETRWAKKNTPQPNPNAETPQQDEAGPSTSAAPTEEAMEPPPPTPGPVPTPEMEEEILEFDDPLPSTPATPIGDLVPFPSTPTAPMDTGETTPPPLAIDERSERIEQLEKQLKDRDDTIKFLREQVRNREALITDLRRQLDQQMAPPMGPPTSSKTPPNRGRPKKRLEELQRSARRDIVDQIVGVIDRDRSRSASRASLDRIHRDIRHKFSHYTPKKGQERKEGMDAEDGLLLLAQLGTQKAQLLSPGDLDGLETAIDQFKAFLDEQPMVRTLLSKKTKAHLLLHHFVPFARQHKFLGLLDGQGDEALHSAWRRLEQLWKTMPDAEQMRQQLEHHFVSNWLMDTGRLDELKLREEERREQAAEDKTNDESDQDADIDVVD
ncbi:hypothetical protein niasHT_030689 [Heterodera trifolii]|uniref:Uncharacterized protein n=1 Tax=Heterodera trifolii TaxID=157864 RepID=A0ABD2HR77_9BILA